MPRPTLGNWKLEENKGYTEEEMPPELWAAQTAVLKLEEQLRERRRQRRELLPIPEVLYHYTDVRGLHGMLDSMVMWLSDAAFMNDPLEGTWVHHRASALAAEILGDTQLAVQTRSQVQAQLSAPPDLWDPDLREAGMSAALSAAMENAFMPAFIASFTEDGDLLSQWRGYGAGGDGVSIGFNLNELGPCEMTEIGDMKIPVAVVKVEYDQDRQDAEIKWIFTEASRVYDDHIGVLSSNPDATTYFTQRFYYALRDAIYWLRWEFKSPHYREEREWRIVANPLGMLRRKSRVAGGHIVPYLEMPLPQTAGVRPQFAIPRIILGPRCQPSVMGSIRRMLTNLASPKVVRSQLALR